MPARRCAVPHERMSVCVYDCLFILAHKYLARTRGGLIKFNVLCRAGTS